MYVIILTFHLCTLGSTEIPRLDYTVKRYGKSLAEMGVVHLIRQHLSKCQSVEIKHIGMVAE